MSKVLIEADSVLELVSKLKMANEVLNIESTHVIFSERAARVFIVEMRLFNMDGTYLEPRDLAGSALFGLKVAVKMNDPKNESVEVVELIY